MITNIYNLVVISYAISYLPWYYKNKEISIPFGTIDIYPIDICLILILVSFAKHVYNQKALNDTKIQNNGRFLLNLFLVLFLYITIKYIIQSVITTGTLRIYLTMSSGYIFIYIYPYLIRTLNRFKSFLNCLIYFAIYIFMLHIILFLIWGYKLHILSGNFIYLIGTVIFILIFLSNELKINKYFSYAVQVIILLTYFMVGHRSALIGLLLSFAIISFFKFKIAIKYAIFFTIAAILIIPIFSFLYSSVYSNLVERWSTTFDKSQETYQGRYYNIFRTINFAKMNSFLGRKIGEDTTRFETTTRRKSGIMVIQEKVHGIVPHNLILEWFYHFGYIGLFIGLLILLSIFKIYLNFYRTYPEKINFFLAGLCSTTNNFFYAFCNTTVSSAYSVFFLYLPVVIMISAVNFVDRGQE